jgi:hypothetical protein
MIAALYVDPRGPYPSLVGVDCWDAARDARLYAGPHAVVAHPPCGPWGGVKNLSRKQDAGLALRAVEQVRAFGGVLEHPRYSALWKQCGLPLPGKAVDEFGGFTLEVSQCDFGHVARKMTWLYCVRTRALVNIPRRREPTHWVSGRRYVREDNARPASDSVPHGIRVCSAQQRRRTPLAFAQWLVALAATVEKL